MEGTSRSLFCGNHWIGVNVENAVAVQEHGPARVAAVQPGDLAGKHVGLDRPQPLGRAHVGNVFRRVIAQQPGAAAQGRGKDVLAQVGELAVDGVPQQVPREDIQGGVRQVAVDAGRIMGLGVEGRDPPASVDLQQVAVVGMVVGMNHERGFGLPLGVEGGQAGQVEVHDRVAVEHEEVFLQAVLNRFKSARRTQRHVLAVVLQPQSLPASVLEMRPDDFSEVAGQEEHVAAAVAAGQLELVFQDRLAGQRHHGLGNLLGERTHARPLAAAEDDYLFREYHGASALPRIRSTAVRTAAVES